jgi:serine/threonine protein kinase
MVDMSSNQKYSAKVDMWGIGCVFYEVLTLTVPSKPYYQIPNQILLEQVRADIISKKVF